MKVCVYGGQYGSEGKGSAAEWFARNRDTSKRLAVFGENSPNSGHTCSKGKTRNLPASSFFADDVILGPDSVISPDILLGDLQQIKLANDGRAPRVFVHEHAALAFARHAEQEFSDGVVASISSTGSGSGAARMEKQYLRRQCAIIKDADVNYQDHGIILVSRRQYVELINGYDHADCIFECSQGTLLDVNWGIYPFVTSRQTLPRVAIERNGLGGIDWSYAGVFRTFPIRTGGPSGPTGGMELEWANLGVPAEQASVTKRIRRVFNFNREDFRLALQLTRPSIVCFTHLDYIGVPPDDALGFLTWYHEKTNGGVGLGVYKLALSNATGRFTIHASRNL